jgi:hypothetical protein
MGSDLKRQGNIDDRLEGWLLPTALDALDELET